MEAEVDLQTKIKLIEQKWYEGNLRGLLFPHQHKFYDHYYENHARKEVWLASRRIGKSADLLVLALELCRKKKRAICRYGAASQKDVREIIHPLMRILTASCPDAIKPYWVESKQKYICPETEAELVVSGLDEGRADNLRGTYMDLGIIDEAGFTDDLDYVLKSVLMPQLLTTNGRIIMASTSPVTPGHPFVEQMEDAKEKDALVTMTIYEDSRPEVIARIPEWMEESGGENSTTWQREYLCKIIIDEDSAIIPEFEKNEEEIMIPWERPKYFQPYTVADLGFVDFTGITFGYVDYARGKKVIEDELLLKGLDTGKISDAIKAKEAELWNNADVVWLGGHAPERYADAQPINIADFNILHKLNFTKTPDDTVEGYVNRLRLDVRHKKIAIHPRCKEHRKHLKHGIWNKSRTKFERTSGFGHYDLLASSMYFGSQVDLSKDPFPENYGVSHETHFMRPKTGSGDKVSEAFKDALGINKFGGGRRK